MQLIVNAQVQYGPYLESTIFESTGVDLVLCLLTHSQQIESSRRDSSQFKIGLRMVKDYL